MDLSPHITLSALDMDALAQAMLCLLPSSRPDNLSVDDVWLIEDDRVLRNNFTLPDALTSSDNVFATWAEPNVQFSRSPQVCAYTAAQPRDLHALLQTLATLPAHLIVFGTKNLTWDHDGDAPQLPPLGHGHHATGPIVGVHRQHPLLPGDTWLDDTPGDHHEVGDFVFVSCYDPAQPHQAAQQAASAHQHLAQALTPDQDTLLQRVIARPLDNDLRLYWAKAQSHHTLTCTEIQLQHLHLCRQRKFDGPEARALYSRYIKEFQPREAKRRPDWPASIRVTFGRGLPEGIKLGLADFFQHADRIFAQAPILHMSLQSYAGDVRDALDKILDSPHLDRLYSLDLRHAHLDDDHLRQLVRHPAARRWVCLDISNNKLTQESLYEIAARMPQLQWLGFAHNVAKDPTPDIADDFYGGGVYFYGDSLSIKERHGERPWFGWPRFETSSPPPAWFYPYKDEEA